MKRRTTLLSLCVGLAVALCAGQVNPVRADNGATVSLSVPWNSCAGGGQTFNPCTTPPDPVCIQGSCDMVGQSMVEQDGRLHLVILSHCHGTGTDPKGITYIGDHSDHILLDCVLGSACTGTFQDKLLMVSQGSLPNFTVTFLIHVTVNANGSMTAFVDSFSCTCQG